MQFPILRVQNAHASDALEFAAAKCAAFSAGCVLNARPGYISPFCRDGAKLKRVDKGNVTKHSGFNRRRNGADYRDIVFINTGVRVKIDRGL